MDRTFFFKQKPVLKIRFKIILSVVVLLLLWLIGPLCIEAYLVCVDPVPEKADRIVLENWTGSLDPFIEVKPLLDTLRCQEVWVLVFKPYFLSQGIKLEAAIAGIDTNKLRFIVAGMEDPKTMHAAVAVVDTAINRGWNELLIAGGYFHSARSKSAYRRQSKGRLKVTMLGLPEMGVSPATWKRNGLGLSVAFSEFVKKVYYDVFVD